MTQSNAKSVSDTSTSRKVVAALRGRPASDGAGVKLTRVIGQPSLPDLDPFLMLDEFRSDDNADYIGGFPDHPHRGFETVTYMLAGRMRHSDNQGNSGILGPGSVQWMTAGRGIVHSEMPEQQDGLMWGFQLWLNLPAKDKMTAPKYQDVMPAQIPTIALANGATVKLIAGKLGETRGPIESGATDATYLDVTLPAAASFEYAMARDYAAFVYVFDGAVAIGPAEARERTERGEVAVLEPGERIEIVAGDRPARFLVAAGRPIKEPIAKYGPFVMNTEKELVQARSEERRVGKECRL